MKIKKLNTEDSKEIANLHNLAFFNFFLTSLGISFLNVFYSSIIKSEHGIALGAFSEGKLVGFAVGAKNKNGFYKTLLRRNFISLSISASSSLLKSPIKIIKLLQSLLSNESSDEKYLNCATLLSICVNPENKGLKVGKFLLEAFELEAAKYNNSITLTTDKINNDYVNNFYLSNNYILNNEFSQGNRKMNYYIKNLNK